MKPPTDTRFRVTLATVQLQPTELTEADFRLPAEQFARLTHSNDLCREGKLFIHKAHAEVLKPDDTGVQGLMQSAMFNVDQSDGLHELRELLDAVKVNAIEQLYPAEQRRIVG